MYPGLASLLQQLSADPADELLASRIVALLLDIPDSEYKVDQLLSAAQMLLPAAPRLALICAHLAFRTMPERLESLAIAEEALTLMGRRAKVRVLREERRRLDVEAVKKPAVFETVSKIVLSGLEPSDDSDTSDEDSQAGEVTILEHRPDRPSDSDSEKTIMLSEPMDLASPDWFVELRKLPELAADLDEWLKRAGVAETEVPGLVQKATAMARQTDEAVIHSVEANRESSISSRLLTILVIDAVFFLEPGVVIQKSDTTYELLARLIAWSESDPEGLATSVQNSIALRIGRLLPHARDSLARVLRDKATAGGRPAPTFSSTML